MHTIYMSKTTTAAAAPQWGTMKALGYGGAETMTVVKCRTGKNMVDQNSKQLPADFTTMVVTITNRTSAYFVFRDANGEWAGQGGAARKLWAVPA